MTETHSASAASEAAVLRELVNRLDRNGYGEYCVSFSPLAPRLEQWRLHRAKVDENLRPLLNLFLLGGSVRRADVSSSVGDLVPALNRLKLLSVDNDKITASGFILLPVLGNWLFFQKPQADAYAYFGEDSIALMTRLRPARNGSCLDLCAGPGLQALQCSLFAASVTAVEIDERAVRLAEINVLMNSRETSISIHTGDLYEPVRGQQFDTVVANPPFIPFPDEAPHSGIGHGGSDGLLVTRRILDALPQFLTAKGTAQIIGACLGHDQPFVVEEFEKIAESRSLDMLMTLTGRHSLDLNGLFLHNLVLRAAIARKASFKDTRDSYIHLLEDTGADQLFTYFLHVRHGAGKMLIQDLSESPTSALWYT